MKTLVISLVSGVCITAALAWPQAVSAQVVFQTTFADAVCAQWSYVTDGNSDAAVCRTGDGIAGHGDWTTNNGSGDQIIAAANYPGGGGGKGYRHFRGDGSNNNGGGLHVTLSAPITEMWVRFYMRYSSGFAWANSGQPTYTKDHYWNVGGANFLIFGIQGNHSWGLHSVNGSTNYPSNLSWSASQGGPVGDGQWHCYEYHAKQNGASGTIEVWVDNVRYLITTADLGSTPWGHFALGSNQSSVTGAGATDYHTDYDDIAISTSGRIGCIGSTVLPSPTNLRVQ